MNLLQMSLSGAILVGFVILFRPLALRTLPKRAFDIMWMVVLGRLPAPFSPLFGIEIASTERVNYQTPAISETGNVPAASERKNQMTAVKPEQSDSAKSDTVRAPQKAERAEAQAAPSLSGETALTAVCSFGTVFMGVWMSAHPLRRCYTVKSFGGENAVGRRADPPLDESAGMGAVCAGKP